MLWRKILEVISEVYTPMERALLVLLAMLKKRLAFSDIKTGTMGGRNISIDYYGSPKC
jgi:hypothetical protein